MTVKKIRKEREKEYGDPKKNMDVTLAIAKAYFGERPVSDWGPEDIAMMGIIFKQGREAFRHKEDNLKDIGGWSDVYLKCKK